MNNCSRLMHRLSTLPDALSAAALTAARDAAEDAARRAMDIVPVRTGALRASIAAIRTPGGAKAVAARPYAVFVELGTWRSAPHPYLLPAAREAAYPARAARAAKEAIP